MKRIHPIKIDDAKYYEAVWGNEINVRPYYDAVRQRALARDVREGMRVLDVGAGVFGTCQYIAEHLRIAADLWAVDQSYTARDIVQRIAPSVHYVVADFMRAMPFSDQEFDVVVAGEVIEHMEDPAAFARELCRVGRRVALSTVDTGCANAIKHGEYPEHLHEFDKSDLVGFFAPFGKTEYTIVGDYHFVYCRCG